MDRNTPATPRLIENLQSVRQRIAAAAQRAGRSPSEITLVAVTKYVSADLAGQLVAAGCRELGESRPQELWQKADSLRSNPPHWHLIGHLQRNKIRRTLPLVSLVHSGDSLRLLEALHEEAERQQLTLPVLLEVNISGDDNKHGFAPAEMESVAQRAAELKSLQVRGLMAMASLDGDLAAARRDFRRLRQLRDQLAADYPALALPELSMGMSHDFEVAIEEGATMVRVGSALFEGVS